MEKVQQQATRGHIAARMQPYEQRCNLGCPSVVITYRREGRARLHMIQTRQGSNVTEHWSVMPAAACRHHNRAYLQAEAIGW